MLVIPTAYFQAARRLFTTNYVLAEFVPLATTRGLRCENTLEFLHDFILLPRLELGWIGETRHTTAMTLLENRLDKKYSLCDAASFIVMREKQLLHALTTDHHFEQEGFVQLLES